MQLEEKTRITKMKMLFNIGYNVMQLNEVADYTSKLN
jgi:hypothetical protein